MTAVRILLGVVTLAAVAVPAAFSGWRWQRSLSRRPLPLQILAATVIAVATVLLTAELLGSVGLFRPLPLIAGTWIVAAVSIAVSTRLAPAAPVEPDATPTNESPRWITLAALAASAAVSVRWVAASIQAVSSGVLEPDSRHYHFPFAAEFARSGWLTRPVPIWPDPIHLFHPGNSELVQGIGMLAMDSDVLAPYPNLAWLGLLLLAGWCAGIRDRVAPITLLAVTFLAGLPVLAHTNGGSGVNDLALLACLVAAVALWRNSHGDLGWWAVGGLALGLAIGTKLTGAGSITALTVAGIAMTPSSRRWRAVGVLVTMLVLGGSFWYLRNLFRTGNPLPSLDVPLLPSPDLALVDRFGFSVADNVFEREAWRTAFWPGVRRFFGWAGLAAAVAGAAAIPRLLRSKDRFPLVIAACGVFALAIWIVTPASAWGLEGRPDPGLFMANLRYTLPGLSLLAIGAALALADATARVRLWFVGWLGVAVAIEVLRPSLTGPPARFMVAAAAGLALAAAALVALRTLPLSPWWRVAAGTGAVLLLVLAAGPAVTRRQLDRSTRSTSAELARVYGWAEAAAPARIGYYAVNAHYPMYGDGWDNDLEFLGVDEAHGGFRSVRDCDEYVAVLADAELEYVVLGPSSTFFEDLDLPAWTEAQDSTSLVLEAPPFAVYEVGAPFDPGRCPPRG